MDYHFVSISQRFLLIFRKNKIFYIILNKKNIKKLLIKHKKNYIFKTLIIFIYHFQLFDIGFSIFIKIFFLFLTIKNDLNNFIR